MALLRPSCGSVVPFVCGTVRSNDQAVMVYSVWQVRQCPGKTLAEVAYGGLVRPSCSAYCV